VDVTTPTDPDVRVEVVLRRDAFDRDPHGFTKQWERHDRAIRRSVERARALLPTLEAPRDVLRQAAVLCARLQTDGIRGELTLLRAARAVAALDGAATVTLAHLRRIAPLALRHRLRRDPLDESGSTARVARAIDEVLGAEPAPLAAR
jgi:magnesium chelatase subunit I